MNFVIGVISFIVYVFVLVKMADIVNAIDEKKENKI